MIRTSHQLPLAAVAPCPRVVELCAGSAAFTLRVLDADGRPPISYPGAKTGYADALLRLAGLMPGQGAREVVWCEPGPWAHVWATLADPVLRAQVVAQLRIWSGEPARPLWDRLRAELQERPIGEDVAGWLFVKGNATRSGHWKSPFVGGQHRNREVNLSVSGLADRIAGYMLAHRWSFSEKGPENGYGGPGCEVKTTRAQWTTADRDKALSVDRLAERTESTARLLPADHLSIYNGSAMDLEPGNEAGTIVLLDPPYLGDGSRKITGYAHTLTRAEVVALALRWRDAGARVLVCESVAIPELVALGWTAHDIAGLRRGQKRTWSAEKAEIVTVSP